MNRQEILERAQREGRSGKDEGIKQAENRGRGIALFMIGLVYLFVLFVNLYYDKTEYNCVPSAFFCAIIAAEAYSRYCFTKKKASLALLVVAALAVVASLIQYVGMVRI